METVSMMLILTILRFGVPIVVLFAISLWIQRRLRAVR
jgi:hypothetical protein